MANGITILPQAQAQIPGLGGFANNLVAGILQQQQQRQTGQQLGQLFGPQFSGITSPFAQKAAAQLGLQNIGAKQDLTSALALQAAKPLPQRKTSFQQISDPETGQVTNALVDSQTGDIIRNFGTTDALTSKDKAQIAVTQAKEFRTDERIKNFQIVERSERGMQAALKQATSPNVKSRIASDQALGVLFQKMLDPTSVVRESEFARTPQGASFINRIQGAAQQLVKGGLSLKNEDRQALVDMAQKLLDESKITANVAFDEFEARADELGLNKKVIFGGRKRFDVADTTTQGQQQGLTTEQETRRQFLIRKAAIQ